MPKTQLEKIKEIRSVMLELSDSAQRDADVSGNMDDFSYHLGRKTAADFVMQITGITSADTPEMVKGAEEVIAIFLAFANDLLEDYDNAS